MSDIVAAQEGNADANVGLKKMVGLRKSIKLTGQGAPVIHGKRHKKSKVNFQLIIALHDLIVMLPLS